MEETISLQEIFAIIKKRLLLIVAFTVGAAVIAAVVSYFFLTPTYESSTKFIVNQGQQNANEQYNVNDIRTNVELINTYNDIIESRAISEDVVEELGLTISADKLASKIQVQSGDNSQVVTVTATDENPQMAVDLANTTVTVFQNKLPDIMNVDNVSILSPAIAEANPVPVSPNPPLNVAIAIVLGGMIGVGLAFLLEYLDTTIATEQDIETHLALPVLGTVSHIDEQDILGMHKTNRNRGTISHAQKKAN